MFRLFEHVSRHGISSVMKRKKIAFIKKTLFSHINASVAQLLARHFPEYDVETIDVSEPILGNKRIIYRNYIDIVRQYPWDLLTRRRTMWECFYRTDYVFKKVKEIVRERLGGKLDDYAFSFQTKSDFDCSVEGLPHFVYTDHTNRANLYYGGYADDKVFPKWYPMEKAIYDRADKVFTMSNHVRQSLIEHYHCSPEKACCVLAGYNVEVKTAALKNDNYGNKHILFVGIEWERKGGPLLVEAFKMVLKKHPDAFLTIVGCSPQIDVPNCKIVGRIPLEDVREHYLKASIFCLPTRLEPFGIVFIESMLYKLPVVAPRIGALPDFIEDGKSGRLTRPNDVNELAAVLTELLDSPEKCRSLGESGYNSVKDRYSWDAVGVRLQTHIREVLEQKKRSH
ncbi:MAG: hypothetical protein JWM68_1960 [Verrucomicrobiales bacterium]|nr:hypothetical protein [Verrucomicrobiales bacterium]